MSMPLDRVTRRELTRLHGRLGLTLSLIGNPVSAIYSLLTEPARHRPRL